MAISFPQIGLEATSTVPRVALRPDLGFMSAASVMHTVPCEPAQQDAGDSVFLRYSSDVAAARCEMPRSTVQETTKREAVRNRQELDNEMAVEASPSSLSLRPAYPVPICGRPGTMGYSSTRTTSRRREPS